MNDGNTSGNRKSSRKRGAGRAGGDQKKTGRSNAGGQSASNKGGGKKRRNKAPKIDPAEFWGDTEQLPDVAEWVTSTPDVTAVVTSLGRPPVPGHETAAEHWFSLVYERSAVLAGALAAAGGLDDEHGDT